MNDNKTIKRYLQNDSEIVILTNHRASIAFKLLFKLNEIERKMTNRRYIVIILYSNIIIFLKCKFCQFFGFE